MDAESLRTSDGLLPMSSLVDADNTGGRVPIRLQRAEKVLACRTERIVLVLEQCMDRAFNQKVQNAYSKYFTKMSTMKIRTHHTTNSHNHQAVLRTAESLGIQTIYVIQAHPVQLKTKEVTKIRKKFQPKLNKNITKQCNAWLTIHTFDSIPGCLAELASNGYEVWASDLSPEASPLSRAHRGAFGATFPPRVALVIGRETDGVSAQVLAQAQRRLYFPMVGFSQSFNLSVATALMLQRLFDWFPEIQGDLITPEREAALRSEWYAQLGYGKDCRHNVELENVEPLSDLRLGRDYHETNLWTPKHIRAREQSLDEFQQRQHRTTS